MLNAAPFGVVFNAYDLKEGMGARGGIAELHRFDRIYAVRPLAQGWRGRAPQSWFDAQDWQYEMWFSVGYAAEVADMRRINRLIEEGALRDPRYRNVELIEVATDHPAGYLNYFTERPQVFMPLTGKHARS